MARSTVTLLLLLPILAVTAVPASAQPLAAGPPFAVSTAPVSILPAPTLAVGPLGRAVFLWLGACPDFALCARAYDTAGVPLGPPAAVDVPVAELGAVPAAAVGPDGRMTLVWSRAGLGFERQIVGRRFTLDLAPAGASFVVAAGSAQVYENPAVSHGAGGALVVVFEKLRFEGFSGEGEGQAPIYVGVEIQARRLAADGTPLGDVFRVDGPGPDLVAAPAVAVAPDGGFLAAWDSTDLTAGEDDVLVRRFAADGTPSGAETFAHAARSGQQSAPAAAASDQGTFLVAWEEVPAGGGTRRVVGQVFDDGGARFPVEFRAGSGAAEQSAPAVAGGDDAFALAWRDERSGGGLWAERRRATGQVLGPDVRLDAQVSQSTARHPAVGVFGGPAADSGLVAGWTRVDDDAQRTVMARRYPAAETPPEPCATQDPGALCLGAGDRFEVRTTWTTANGAGVGTAQGLTGDTGYFWFFKQSNVEAVVKVLNGCAVNGRFWVFAGGLTNVGVRLTVRDTSTGVRKTYDNPLRTPFQPIQDTSAFLCP